MRVRDDAPTKSADLTSLSSGERHMLDLDDDLWTRLRHTAQARDQPPEGLAAILLTRGLEQEAKRARAEDSLESLTPREQQVALLTLRGLTNREIATVLVISPETVKTHIRHTLEKFGLHSKAELRLMLLEVGCIQRHP